ncbi:MAG: hypothetical protein NTW87_09420 [Planctomycetota bacterium]|nr:hypothetical protein [Planctomycetota bacterium]
MEDVGLIVVVAGVCGFYAFARAIHNSAIAPWLLPLGVLLMLSAGIVHGLTYLLGIECHALDVVAYVIGFSGVLACGVGFECLRISLGMGFWGFRSKVDTEQRHEQVGSARHTEGDRTGVPDERPPAGGQEGDGKGGCGPEKQ